MTTYIERHQKCSSSVLVTTSPLNLIKSMEFRPISSSSQISSSSVSNNINNNNNNNNNNNTLISTDSTLSSLQHFGERPRTTTCDTGPSSCKSNDYYTKKRIAQLHERLDDNQTISFLQFVNYHLSQERGHHERQALVNDISNDLRDGLIFIDLIEIFSSTKLKREHGRTRFHAMANVRTVLDYLKLRTPLIDISPTQIVCGNRKQTLALLWMIMKVFDFPKYRLTNTHCYAENTLLGFGQDRSTTITWLNQILNHNSHTRIHYIRDFYIETWISGDYLTIIIKYLVPLSTKYLTYECFNYLKELDDSNWTNRQRFQLCFDISKYCFNTLTIIDITDRTERPLFRYFTELQHNVLVIQETNPIGKLMQSNLYTKQVFDTVIQTNAEHSTRIIKNNEQYLSCIDDDNQPLSTSKQTTTISGFMDSSTFSSPSNDTSLDLQVSDISDLCVNKQHDEKRTENVVHLLSDFPAVNNSSKNLYDESDSKLSEKESHILNDISHQSDHETLSDLRSTGDFDIPVSSSDASVVTTSEISQSSMSNDELNISFDKHTDNEPIEEFDEVISDVDQSESCLQTINKVNESRISLENEPMNSIQAEMSNEVVISELSSQEEVILFNEEVKSLPEEDNDENIEQTEDLLSKREQLNLLSEENIESATAEFEASLNKIIPSIDTNEASTRTIDNTEEPSLSFVSNEPEKIELPQYEEQAIVVSTDKTKEPSDECEILQMEVEHNDTLSTPIHTIEESQPCAVSNSSLDQDEVVVSIELNKQLTENDDTLQPITISQGETEQFCNSIHESLQCETPKQDDQQSNNEIESSVNKIEESTPVDTNLQETDDVIDTSEPIQSSVRLNNTQPTEEEINHQVFVSNEINHVVVTENEMSEPPTATAISITMQLNEDTTREEATTTLILEEIKATISEDENENQQIAPSSSSSSVSQLESIVVSNSNAHHTSTDCKVESFQDDGFDDQITAQVTESNSSISTSSKKLEKPTVIALPQPLSSADADFNNSTIQNQEFISVSQSITLSVSSVEHKKSSTVSNESSTQSNTAMNHSQESIPISKKQPSAFKGPTYSDVVSGKSPKPVNTPTQPTGTVKKHENSIELQRRIYLPEVAIENPRQHSRNPHTSTTSITSKTKKTNSFEGSHNQCNESASALEERSTASLEVKQSQTSPNHKSKRSNNKKTKSKDSSIIVETSLESILHETNINTEEVETSIHVENSKTDSSILQTSKTQQEDKSVSTISKQASNDLISTNGDHSTATRPRHSNKKKGVPKSTETPRKKNPSSVIETPASGNVFSIAKALLDRKIVGPICVFALICFCFTIFMISRSQT